MVLPARAGRTLPDRRRLVDPAGILHEGLVGPRQHGDRGFLLLGPAPAHRLLSAAAGALAVFRRPLQRPRSAGGIRAVLHPGPRPGRLPRTPIRTGRLGRRHVPPGALPDRAHLQRPGIGLLVLLHPGPFPPHEGPHAHLCRRGRHRHPGHDPPPPRAAHRGRACLRNGRRPLRLAARGGLPLHAARHRPRLSRRRRRPPVPLLASLFFLRGRRAHARAEPHVCPRHLLRAPPPRLPRRGRRVRPVLGPRVPPRARNRRRPLLGVPHPGPARSPRRVRALPLHPPGAQGRRRAPGRARRAGTRGGRPVRAQGGRGGGGGVPGPAGGRVGRRPGGRGGQFPRRCGATGRPGAAVGPRGFSDARGARADGQGQAWEVRGGAGTARDGAQDEHVGKGGARGRAGGLVFGDRLGSPPCLCRSSGPLRGQDTRHPSVVLCTDIRFCVRFQRRLQLA
ncbi:hypothetical protein DFJ74DRAFT_773792, partial [Hyaloraphidium curvatum]